MSTIHSPIPPQTQSENYVTPPPLTIFLTGLLFIILFLSFFTFYFCKFFITTITQAWRRHYGIDETTLQPPPPPPPPPLINPGLDLKIINSFPTFSYSSVKDLREDKYGLECAICLNEFDEDHVIRLLITCSHVFHQECIDFWFESHKTCPVCRCDLDLPLENTNNEIIINVIQEISDDHLHYQNQSKNEENLVEKFSRSNSTGHSIVRNKLESEEDKYTLRLPEHVKIKITRRHNQTESCVSFSELVKNRGHDHLRFGEVSDQTVDKESENLKK